MIRFKNAGDLEFTLNPQVSAGTATVYHKGLRVGFVVSHYDQGRGKCYRVYDNKKRCHADCGQFGNVFSVLRGMEGVLI